MASHAGRTPGDAGKGALRQVVSGDSDTLAEATPAVRRALAGRDEGQSVTFISRLCCDSDRRFPLLRSSPEISSETQRLRDSVTPCPLSCPRHATPRQIRPSYQNESLSPPSASGRLYPPASPSSRPITSSRADENPRSANWPRFARSECARVGNQLLDLSRVLTISTFTYPPSLRSSN